MTTLSGIPCTTVARTLLDLADVVDRRALERACEQAEVLQVFDGRALEDVLARAVGRRGASTLRAVLDMYADGADAAVTESELEERFLLLCSEHAIERPRVNQWIALHGGPVKVDFLWPGRRLVVETDGRRVHGSHRAFERDRRRDQRLLLAGYRVARFTWRQVVEDTREVAATVQRLLASTR